MSQRTTLEIEQVPVHSAADSPQERISTWRLGLGVAAMSFASLLLELSLTRLFSVTLYYHFAFLAISIALLGLGAGGVFAHIFKSRLERVRLSQLGQTVCVLNAALMVLVLVTDLNIPVQITFGFGNLLRLTAMYLISSLPFGLTGLLFSTLFARKASLVSQLYAADLVGGAAACMALVPLLNTWGAPNSVIAAGVAMAVAALFWTEHPKAAVAIGGLMTLMVLLVLANRNGRLIDIVYAKGFRRDKLDVEFARWNAISRVEVDNDHGLKNIVIDADASSYIMVRDPQLPYEGTDFQAYLTSAPPSAVNWLRPHGNYAIIGPGGGIDVMRAVFSGSPSVTGIEINPLIANDIMRQQYAKFSYGLYLRPNVHIKVSDGRSWVRNSGEKFDVLQMTLVDTWASTSAGAFSLSENNLYTLEAFREYFDHLKPDGILAITRWDFDQPREALRVVAQAMRALGAGDLRRNFIVVAAGTPGYGYMVTVLAKKTPFTTAEETSVRERLSGFSNLLPIYLPSDGAYADGADPYTADLRAFRHLIQSGDPEGYAAHYSFNVAPVYDNAPFFFFTLKPSGFIHSGTHSLFELKNNMGVVVLAMLLIISVGAVAVFLVVPLLLTRGSERMRGSLPMLYFVALGVGYIAIEITLIQRLVLFLGHPIYAMTVVVFLMLLSSGIGSAMSRRWISGIPAARLFLGAIVVSLVGYYFVLPVILHRLIGLAVPAKIAISAVLIVPVGLLMGTPFPSGIRMLKPSGQGSGPVEWAWALNAGASVLGSVLSMSLAIQFGLGVTLLSGALAYAIGIVLAGTLPSREPAAANS